MYSATTRSDSSVNLAAAIHDSGNNNLDHILKNQKEILESIRVIQEKLGISVERSKDPENPAAKDSSDEDEEAKRKRMRAAIAGLKWKSTLKALTARKDED